MALRNYSLHLVYVNKRYGRPRLIDVLSRRMAVSTHNLPYGRLKKRTVELDEAMLHGVVRPFEHIFCILDMEIRD
jgi:hypothetical protein